MSRRSDDPYQYEIHELVKAGFRAKGASFHLHVNGLFLDIHKMDKDQWNGWIYKEELLAKEIWTSSHKAMRLPLGKLLIELLTNVK